MKNYILILFSVAILFGCKKEKKPSSEVISPPQTAPTTLPASNYKRVKTLKQYDTLASPKHISTHAYEYSFVSGLLVKETITDSSISSSTSVNTTVLSYKYTSAGKIDSYTTTANSTSSILKYVYNTSNQVMQELTISVPNLDTTITAYYSHSGNLSSKYVTFGTSSTSYKYIDGDIDEYRISSSFFSNILVAQYSYDPALIDKSKLNFNETAPLTANCRLLTSVNYPSSPLYFTPKNVTYTYIYDVDGYPVAYENSDNTKWRVNYY